MPPQKYVMGLLRKWRDRMALSPIVHRLSRGAFWSISGNSAARAVSMVMTVIITRILGKEEYGRVSIIQSTVDMFSAASGLGLSFTATKHVAEFRKSNPQRAGRIIAMTSVVAWLSGGIFSLFLLVFARWLATNTLHSPGMTNMLRTGSCLLLFATVNAAQIGSLTGFEAFKRRAKINVYAGLCALPVTISGAYFYGAQGAIYGFVCSAALLCILNAMAVRIEARKALVPLGWRNWRKEAPLVLKFGIPAMAATLISTPTNWYCNTLLVRSSGGFVELGAYNAANQWFNAIIFLPSALSVVSIPILTELISEKKWHSLSKLTWNSVKLHTLIVIPAVILMIASPWVMRLYGRGFAATGPIMVLQVASAVIVAVQAPVWPLFFAAGWIRPVILLNMVWACVFIALAWFGVKWGALGLAGARLSAYFVGTTGMFIMAYILIKRGKKESIDSEPALSHSA